MINFESDVTLEEFDFDVEKVALEVTEKVLDSEGCPYECEIDVLITDADTVWQINKEYRDVDRTTDVLSFPNVDWTFPADYSCDGFNDDFLVSPDTECIMLGQIVLNKEKVLEQAKEFGHSKKREYAFLIAHSMLHLLGYDHMTEEEASVMENKQSQYLNEMGIIRE